MNTKRRFFVVVVTLLGCALCCVDVFSQLTVPDITGQWKTDETENGTMLVQGIDDGRSLDFRVTLSLQPVSEGKVEGVWKVRWNDVKNRFEGTGSFLEKIPGEVPMFLTFDTEEIRTALKFTEAQKPSWIRAIYDDLSNPVNVNVVENFQQVWVQEDRKPASADMPDISGKWRGVRDGAPVEYIVKPVINSDPANRRKSSSVFTVSRSSTIDAGPSINLKWLRTSRFFVGVDPVLNTEIRFRPRNDGTELRLSCVDEQFFQTRRRELIEQGKKTQAGELTQTWTLIQAAEKDEMAWLPKVVQPLRAAVVSITRIDRRTGLPTANWAHQMGIVVDPRGYILTCTHGSEIEEPQFKVQFLDKSVRVAEFIDNEQSLTLSLLKVEVTEPIPAISLKTAPVASAGTKVLGVTSKPRLPPLGGRITSDGVNFGGPPHHSVALDLMIREGEGGCLATTDRGLPLAILLSGSEGSSGSYAIPLMAARDFIEGAIGEPGRERPSNGLLKLPSPQSSDPNVSGDEPVYLGTVPVPEEPSATNPQPSRKERSRFAAVPDTSAAKELLNQLQERESAAAAQVEQIRRLQVGDQDKQDPAAIAQQQRKLKSLLNEAFDLKLQLEELQVKELQSRLSQLERQIGQRKALRDKIIDRRADELMKGEVPAWQPSSEKPSPPVDNVNPRKAPERFHSQTPGFDKPVGSSAIAPVGNSATANVDAALQSARETIRPFVDKVAECQKHVRELESFYYRDRSIAPELQKAWNGLSDARKQFSENFKPIDKSLKLIGNQLAREIAVTQEIATVRNAQRENKSKLHIQGSVVEDEMKSVISASARAADAHAEAIRAYEEFGDAIRSFVPDGARELWSRDYLEAPQVQEEFDEFTVLTWMERSLKLKLEFVQFDGLNLPFKAALRVRKSSGEYQVDDLIVMSGGHYAKINSLNQLANELCRYCQDNEQNPNPNVVLRGGLAGPLVEINEPGWKWTNARDHLLGINPSQAIWQFEVRVRRKGDPTAKTAYLSGVCVSLDGLVAMRCPEEALENREKIIVVAPQHGTAHVVAADNHYGMTLLKITPSTLANRSFDPGSVPAGLTNHELFRWVKCQMAVASPGQAIKIFDWQPNSPNSNVITEYKAFIASAIDAQKGTSESDGARFFVASDVNDSDLHYPSRNARATIAANKLSELTPGSPVTTNDKELLGVLDFDSEIHGRRPCVPARVIEQLLKEYRQNENTKN